MKYELEKIVNDIKENGFSRIPNFLSDTVIDEIKKERNEVIRHYSLGNVQTRLFYLREESHNRQGDAVMVSEVENDMLPSFTLVGKSLELMNMYNSVLGAMTGVQVENDSRCMMNSQQYFADSKPVNDHYDGEFFEFEHTENVKEDGLDNYSVQMNKGLIPRYVMVAVLENENNGKGTYVRMHDSEDRIDLENNKGDLIIFDNLAMRHGVWGLENPRSMIGFRNFDHQPYYFEKDPQGGNDWLEVQDELNPGWVKELSSDDAKEMMHNFNIKWCNELFEEQVKKPAAF